MRAYARSGAERSGAAIHMFYEAVDTMHAVWVDSIGFARTTQASFCRSYAGNGVLPTSSRPRQHAQLTSAGCGSTLPLARMGLTPAPHAAGAMRPSASLPSPIQRPATAGGPIRMAPTSLWDTGQLHHSDTVGGGAGAARTLQPISATVRFSRLSGRI